MSERDEALARRLVADFLSRPTAERVQWELEDKLHSGLIELAWRIGVGHRLEAMAAAELEQLAS